MVHGREQLPFRAPTIDQIVIQGLARGLLVRCAAEFAAVRDRFVRQLVNGMDTIEQAEARLVHKRNSPIFILLDLNKTRHGTAFSGILQPMTSNCSSAFSLMLKPKPGTFSSRSMKPSLALGSPVKMYQKSSFPTSTSTMGKYSAMGEFRLAITT